MEDGLRRKRNPGELGMSALIEKKAYRIVLDYFTDHILNGKMKTGDKLPAERELAEQLGISRNSVREAIRMMEIMGFIESRQGSGNYICCNSQEYMTRACMMMMVLWDTNYSDVYHVRRAVELHALELAAERITQEELDRLGSLAEQMEQPCSVADDNALDIEFHGIIIQASQNKLLILLISLMGDSLENFISGLRMSILSDPARAAKLHRAHRDIYESLAQHDAAGACRALERHYEIVSDHLQKFEKQKFSLKRKGSL